MPVSLATALFNRPSLFRIIAEARNTWEMDQIKKDIIRIIKNNISIKAIYTPSIIPKII